MFYLLKNIFAGILLKARTGKLRTSKENRNVILIYNDKNMTSKLWLKGNMGSYTLI